MDWMRGEVNWRIWGWFVGGIRAACYSTRGYCSRLGLWRRLGLEGRRERRPRGFAHGRQERRVFLLISCLIRLIHLSLNREDYLTPKQELNLIPKPNPNGPPGPLGPWHLTGNQFGHILHWLDISLLPFRDMSYLWIFLGKKVKIGFG
jgi:hypothetical protein